MASSPDPPPTPERSRLMSRVKSADTTPEWIVRRLLHGMGYRYRLHRKGLPGTPDIVFPGRRKAIFVHGCFWHRHEGCGMTTTPKTRAAFWREKFEANRERDLRKFRKLAAMGWEYLVVWECETRRKDDLKRRLSNFLDAFG
uniref:Very short patch repair endonuclease n=1 Tax=Candidatus Kentrum sp. TC TaxID=2126339 RepID=A0A450ZYA4_9GAMM|nr:MAG: DNA mismatch endonuclease, patch repair protein [Candidatus Kentron sp. TC]